MALTRISNQSLTSVTALPAAITTGKILQIVSSENAYTHSTTSSSMVDIESSSGTAWETTITPSATSSKIIIMANLLMTMEQNGNSNNRGEISTNIKIGSGSYSNLQQGMMGNYDYGGSGCQNRQRVQMQFITSPSSTDACKVKFQMKGTSGTSMNFNDNNAILDSTCILYEVAG